jgi:hypothetical protein
MTELEAAEVPGEARAFRIVKSLSIRPFLSTTPRCLLSRANSPTAGGRQDHGARSDLIRSRSRPASEVMPARS